MSLNWNSTKCKQPADKRDENVRYVLIFATMMVGIPDIKATNWKEFYARVHLHELVAGTFLSRHSEDGEPPTSVFLEPSDIFRWIGLSTNATPKTRTQFLRGRNYDLDRFAKDAYKWEFDNKHTPIKKGN